MGATVRQPIDDGLPNDGSTAGNGANGNIKIINVSGGNGAKVEGGKITLNLKGADTTNKAANNNVEVAQPKPSQIKSSDNSITPTAANDNQEEPLHTEKEPSTEKPENFTPETTHPNQPTPDKTPSTSDTNKGVPGQTDNELVPNADEQIPPNTEEKPPAVAPQDNTQTNQTNNQNPPDQHQTNPETEQIPPNSENNPPPQDEQPAQENPQSSENGQQPPTNSNEQTPPPDATNDKKKPPESQAETVPPTSVPENTEPKPWRSDMNPNADKRPPTVNQPSKTDNDALSQTGPHVSPNTPKTPPTVPPHAQPGSASGMASDKANKGIGDKIGDSVKRGATNIKEAPGKMIGNIKKNIASSLESDRSRVKKLKKERKEYGTELTSLDGDVEGMKSNPAMLILKTLARPIFGDLTNLTFGKANASDNAKIVSLKTALLTLNTVKSILYAMIAAVDYVESLVNIAKFGAALTEIVIGFFIIALSPFVSIPFFIFKFGAGTGKFSRAIRSIIKDIIDPMVEKINKLLERLNKKVDLRKKIIKINQLLSATKQERKEHIQQQEQEKKQQTNNISNTAAANDNVENSNSNESQQNNFKQAA